MKILITGIHGFVGSNLVKALKNKYEIYGLDIISPQKEGVIKTFLWNDLTQLPEIDIIIHLAGKAHDTKNRTESKIYFDINTGLTEKIYDWFLQSNAKKFIFFSSVKAAADKVIGDVLTENIIPSPIGPYGESKIAAENYILSKQPTRNNKEKKTYILRPCMIHGPGNKGNLNLLYAFVKKGIPYPLGAFDNKRSFTSIDNLNFFVENIISKEIESGIYNVADDETLSTKKLIEIMSKTMNRPTRIWKINQSLIKIIAKTGTSIKFPLNEERLQKLTENYIVSNQKLKSAIDVNKLPVTATEGLKKTIESFQKK